MPTWRLATCVEVAELMTWPRTTLALGSTGVLMAEAAGRPAGVAADEVVLDPLRNQQPSLVDGGLRVMNAIERRACLKGGHIIRTDLPELTVRCDDSPFAAACNAAFVTHASVPSFANFSQQLTQHIHQSLCEQTSCLRHQSFDFTG
jgi:hypothetical protein